MKTLLATLLVGAAVALPMGTAHARGDVSIRIHTPEFGFRIGPSPRHYGPVYGPPVVIAPAPGYRHYPNYYGGVRHLPYGHYKRWHGHHPHWKHHYRHWKRHHRWDDGRWDHHRRWDRDDHDGGRHHRHGRH